MSWHGIQGHDEVVERFRCALARGRLAASLLFVGPEGIGKRAFAMTLARALLCQTNAEATLNPCGECPACTQVLAGTHPDLYVVGKPEGKAFIPVKSFIGDRDHRMREGLCHDIGLKPFMGGRKVAIIDDADYLNAEGANCLLKTLEEPPPRSVLILIGTSAARQLPTIRSRCQLIRFRPLATDAVAELLVARRVVETAEDAGRLAERSEGSPGRAAELADSPLWDFRERLLQRLAEPPLDSFRLARAVSELVGEAGREAAARRARLRQIVGFVADFYRYLLYRLTDAGMDGDTELGQATVRAAGTWRGGAAAAADCLDRCLEAAEQIDRNANQATLVECWLDDLAEIAAIGKAAPVS